MSLARKEPGVIQSLSLEFGLLRFGMRYLAQVKREWRFKQVSLLVYTAAGLFGSSSLLLPTKTALKRSNCKCG